MNLSRLSALTYSLLIAGAIIVGATVVARSLGRNRSAEDVIRVTGSARRVVRSDYIIWTAKVNYQAPTASAAYQGLQKSVSQLNAYLTEKGIPSEEIFPLAITTETLYDKPAAPTNGNMSDVLRTIAGYRLSQEVEVRSQKVDVVQGVSRTATDLINQGVSVESVAPQYRITKLAELKDAILAEAAENARKRAENIAKSSGSTLGPLRFAHMGMMLVTGAYDDEEGGREDIASLDKKVTVQVTSAFGVQ